MDTTIIVAIVLPICAIVLVVAYIFWQRSKHWKSEFDLNEDNAHWDFYKGQVGREKLPPSVWANMDNSRQDEIISNAVRGGQVHFTEHLWDKLS